MLAVVTGVGRLTADRIMSFRQQYDNINASDLIEIPRLKLTRQLLDMIDFSPVGPEPTAYPACIQCDVEVQDYYDYGNIETSQTPLQYKYTTKADVDDDEDFSDEYLLKQEDEEVREHSRFPSELRKLLDYTLNLRDHQYYSKIKTVDKDVGQHAATVKPSSVETAIDHIKWYQHNHTAIFGKPTNRRESSRDDDYDVDLTTQAVTKAETKKTDMQTVSQHIELLMDKITAMETTHRKELESIRSEIKRQQILIQ